MIVDGRSHQLLFWRGTLLRLKAALSHGILQGSARIIVGAMLIGCTVTRHAEPPYRMTDNQWTAVRSLLHSQLGWRLAVESDNKSTAAIKQLREGNPAFEPYFAETSGRMKNADFAIALRNGKQFKVFYFRATHTPPTYEPPHEVTTVDWLDDGRIRLVGDTLDVAPFQSDEIFRFIWSRRTNQMELAADSTE